MGFSSAPPSKRRKKVLAVKSGDSSVVSKPLTVTSGTTGALSASRGSVPHPQRKEGEIIRLLFSGQTKTHLLFVIRNEI